MKTDLNYRFIAAERPPHLKAIAPWEGVGDFYREQVCRGGIPGPQFWTGLLRATQGMVPLTILEFS